MYQLQGMLDGSVAQPSTHVLTAQGTSLLNPAYSYWLRVDQLIRAWLFATVSKDTLSEVHDLQHSAQV